MPERVQKYIPSSNPETDLRQGEILSSVVQVRLKEGAALAGPDQRDLLEIHHGWTIVATQDCDLEQDFRARGGTVAVDKQLPNILLCMAQEAGGLQIAKDVWKRLQQNKDERYQFLEEVPAEFDAMGQGVPELVVDFKQYFTLPTDELYARIKQRQARRRCRLSNAYLAHFASRFSYFQSRIALPDEHASL